MFYDTVHFQFKRNPTSYEYKSILSRLDEQSNNLFVVFAYNNTLVDLKFDDCGKSIFIDGRLELHEFVQRAYKRNPKLHFVYGKDAMLRRERLLMFKPLDLDKSRVIRNRVTGFVQSGIYYHDKLKLSANTTVAVDGPSPLTMRSSIVTIFYIFIICHVICLGLFLKELYIGT